VPLIDNIENILKEKINPFLRNNFFNFRQKSTNKHSQNIFGLLMLIGMALSGIQ